MIKAFIEISSIVHKAGGTVAFEWPEYCLAWNVKELNDHFVALEFQRASFHGCSFGLSHNGKLVKKPWAVMTTSEELHSELSEHVCNCPRGSHAAWGGKIAVKSELYTQRMANAVVRSLRQQPTTGLAAQTYIEDAELDLSYAAQPKTKAFRA